MPLTSPGKSAPVHTQSPAKSGKPEGGSSPMSKPNGPGTHIHVPGTGPGKTGLK